MGTSAIALSNVVNRSKKAKRNHNGNWVVKALSFCFGIVIFLFVCIVVRRRSPWRQANEWKKLPMRRYRMGRLSLQKVASEWGQNHHLQTYVKDGRPISSSANSGTLPCSGHASCQPEGRISCPFLPFC